MPSASPVFRPRLWVSIAWGDHGGRRVLVPFRDHDCHLVCCENLQRTGEGGHREGVSVEADEQGAVDLLLFAMQTDRLGYGEDVPFVEGSFKRRSRDVPTCRKPLSVPGPKDRESARSREVISLGTSTSMDVSAGFPAWGLIFMRLPTDASAMIHGLPPPCGETPPRRRGSLGACSPSYSPLSAPAINLR